MSIIDDVNRVWREFRRYTGDGLPDEPLNANLPVGDPNSGANTPKKSEIRGVLTGLLQLAYNILEQAAEGAVPDIGVSTSKVQDGAITEPKLADGAGSTRVLAGGAVTLAKIADDAKAEFRLVDPNGPRIPMRYMGATQLQFAYQPGGFAMGGFRYHGRFRRNRVPIFPAPAPSDNNRHIVDVGNGSSTSGDLAFETTARQKTWYAVFAVANAGDTVAQFKITPFLKVRTVAGNVITLSASGEADYTSVSRTHTFATNGLAGAECLVINETLSGRANAWSGRMATITANTTSTVTLSSAGSMAFGDWFLPAPKFDHYVYLGCGYFEASSGSLAELRNFADSGALVKTRGTNLLSGSGWASSGAIAGPPGNRVVPAGHVAPLATGMVFSSTISLATTSGGSLAEYFNIDSGDHGVWDVYIEKTATSNLTQVADGITIPFMFAPEFYAYTGGTLTAVRSSQILVRGWIEP